MPMLEDPPRRRSIGINAQWCPDNFSGWLDAHSVKAFLARGAAKRGQHGPAESNMGIARWAKGLQVQRGHCPGMFIAHCKGHCPTASRAVSGS